MPYKDLKEFIARLKAEGELVEIQEPVAAHLEVSEICDRVVKAGGPALLFHHVTGYQGRPDARYPMPLLINTFGTLRRMEMALETPSLDAVAEEITGLLEPEVPKGLLAKLKMLPMVRRLGDLVPKSVKDASCQEVVETANPSLEGLPIIQCWPGDAGPYITLPMVFTRHPVEKTPNIGMYRLQKFDNQTLGLHWQRHKGGAEHYRVAEGLGQRLEVAIALGPDPAVIYSATAPLPEGIDELMLAGFLRRQSVEVVRCKTVDLEVPANSQIVLEGYCEPGERRREGPFGDHTGFYSLADDYPVFHLTAVTHQRDPIYPTIIVGRPPMEDGPLGKGTERIFLPLIKKTVPEIVDINLPVEGIFHNFAIVSIRKRYPGHARKVMHAIWGLGQLMFTKVVIVVDERCNVQDLQEVMWRVGTHFDPKHDVLISEGPADVLEFANRMPDYGGKMGIDATRKWPDEGYTREWPPEIEMDSDVRARVSKLWPKLGLG
ncbi:MAG TPA: menaquinone biosynthesis decarboxylase [Armatimonadota bacterium]|jgi:4-hydroxy-3-polyprenylbenzoate decarboxylase